MKTASICLIALAVLSAVSLQSNAELIVRGTDSLGNQLIYDTDLNITWYDYTRPTLKAWWAESNWASSLTVDFGGTIYDDWRLPSTVDGPYVFGYDGTTTAGYNITSSEIGHLYYTELGNKGYCDASGSCPQAGWGLTNTGPFQNLDARWAFASGTLHNDYLLGTGGWIFDAGTGGGVQYVEYDLGAPDYFAIAVRDGDVTVVPEPISSTLFLIGVGVLAGRRFFEKDESLI